MQHSGSVKPTTLETSKIPTVSLPDSLVYNLVHVIPLYLRGIFSYYDGTNKYSEIPGFEGALPDTVENENVACEL